MLNIKNTLGNPDVKFTKKFALAAIFLLILQGIFIFGLIIGAMVPNTAIVSNLEKAEKHNTFGPVSAPDRMGADADTFTECVVSVLGIHNKDQDTNPFSTALHMPRLASCDQNSSDNAQLAIKKFQENQNFNQTDYFRYWAGMTVLTRPLLALLGLDYLRMIVAGLALLASFLTVMKIRDTFGGYYPLFLFTPILFTSNILSLPSTGFTHLFPLIVVMLTLYYICKSGIKSYDHLALIGLIAGSVYCYVDLLTVPTMGWATAASVSAAAYYYRRDEDVKGIFKAMIITGIAWPIGFAFTWISRWVIAVLTVGYKEAAENIGGKISERTGSDTNIDHHFGAATSIVTKYWVNTFPTAIPLCIAGLIIILIALILSYRKLGLIIFKEYIVLCCPILIIPAWYELLSNHSQIHFWFVYRTIPFAVGLIVANAVLVYYHTVRNLVHETNATSISHEIL